METLILKLCTVLGHCLEPDDYARLLRLPAVTWTNSRERSLRQRGLREPFDKIEWRNVTSLSPDTSHECTHNGHKIERYRQRPISA
jgi:hypothetical protein